MRAAIDGADRSDMTVTRTTIARIMAQRSDPIETQSRDVSPGKEYDDNVAVKTHVCALYPAWVLWHLSLRFTSEHLDDIIQHHGLIAACISPKPGSDPVN